MMCQILVQKVQVRAYIHTVEIKRYPVPFFSFITQEWQQIYTPFLAAVAEGIYWFKKFQQNLVVG